MEKDSVLALKQETLDSLRKEAKRRLGAGTESLVNPRVGQRLSVGYSEQSRGDFRLELRVQRGRGRAYKEAERLKEKARQEANIQIVPRIEIPTKTALLEDKRGHRSLTTRKRPLHIGLSVGHPAGGAGTLGAFIDTPGGDAILSNQHVLAPTGAELGQKIYQPGEPDRKWLQEKDRIAKLWDFGVVDRSRRNLVDYAVAVLVNGDDHESNRIPPSIGCPLEGQVLTQFANYDILGPNLTVCKIGRTTGYREGKISAIALDNVPIWTSDGNVLFDNLIEVRWESNRRPFSLPGDSGSLVFTKDDLIAVGLHFAGGKVRSGKRELGVSYSCSLADIMRALDASLLD